LKAKIKQAHDLIQSAKRQSFHEFCSSVDGKTTTRDMWNKMRWLKGHRRIKDYIDENSTIELLRSLTPDMTLPPLPNITNNYDSPIDGDISFQELDKFFSLL
jgi:hypothetical protein